YLTNNFSPCLRHAVRYQQAFILVRSYSCPHVGYRDAITRKDDPKSLKQICLVNVEIEPDSCWTQLFAEIKL
ncbi:13240_t:CDS:2, partial [Funneliformis geosporum]